MHTLETEGRTYKNVTVLPFLLSEMASINAAFLPDKAWRTSDRYEGVLRRQAQKFSGVVIALVMRAVRGGGAPVWAAAEQCRTAQTISPKVTFQIFPGISLGEGAIQGSIHYTLTRHFAYT